MESNVLCSILVMMLTVPRQKTAVLCTLDYTDHTRCLPTRVNFESEGKDFCTPEVSQRRWLATEHLLPAAKLPAIKK